MKAVPGVEVSDWNLTIFLRYRLVIHNNESKLYPEVIEMTTVIKAHDEITAFRFTHDILGWRPS